MARLATLAAMDGVARVMMTASACVLPSSVHPLSALPLRQLSCANDRSMGMRWRDRQPSARQKRMVTDSDPL